MDITVCVVIYQYVQIHKHYVLHLELIWCYENYVSIKNVNKQGWNMWIKLVSFLPHLSFSGGSDSKESDFSVGDPISYLGQDDPLEKGMVTHSSILAWRIPWTEEPGGLQSIGSQSWTRLKWLSMHAHMHGSPDQDGRVGSPLPSTDTPNYN